MSKAFGERKVLEGFNLLIKPGDMVALWGVSGSGKTTLLNIMGLIEPIDSGNYDLFDHRNITSGTRLARQAIRNEISYLFQNFALVDDMTVEQNLRMGLYYVRISRDEQRRLIAQGLGAVGLEGYEKSLVYELSGGEQQRVSLARSIIKPSRLLLADEPTGSVDIMNRDVVLEILKRMNKDGKTIIIATHDPFIANQCSHSVVLS
ncbi:MAG: ATP-binding cassette domain-containing protein [Coriobacteriales bacterium]|nr:ATP-binding cassette domain-containing protein [Coriobacteriales bacterium]